MIGLAAGCAGLAAWFLFPDSSVPVARLTPGEPTHPRRRNTWVLLGVGVVFCGVLGFFFPGMLIMAAVCAIGLTVGWVVSLRLRLKRARLGSLQVARATQVVESLVGLGHIPTTALKLAAQECPLLEPASQLVSMGGQPWEVMEQLSMAPGQEGLAQIGHAWRVSQISGSSMCDPLEQVRINLEEASAAGDVVRGELAGPRATAQMLAVFPFLGMAMASGLGANPLVFFTSTVVGRLCFLAGIFLGCVGMIWSESVAASELSEPRRSQ